MKDLRSRLMAISERGVPVGSSLLRERVAVELSGAGLRPETSRRVAPGWLLAAAFAATALLVGIPVVLLYGRGGGPADQSTTSVVTTTTVPTSTTVPSTTTTTAPTTTVGTTTTTTLPEPPLPVGMEWQRVADPGIRGWIFGLAATNPGLVATGSGIWWSEDGSEWHPAEGVTFEEGDFVADVAVGSDGSLVAVGVSEGFPAVWTSPDGRGWARLEGQGLVFRVRGRLSEVTAAPFGWVAVGEAADVGRGGPARVFVGLWVSADGVTWERVASEGETPWAQAHVTELLAWEGAVYALGYRDNPVQSVETPTVWRSEDGRAWDSVDVGRPEEYPNTGAWIEGATVTDAGLFAVGLEMSWWEPPDTYNLAVWRSEDGLTWALLPTDFRVEGRSTHGSDLKPVAGDGRRLVAGELCAYVWASGDAGNTWEQVTELDLSTPCATTDMGGAAWAMIFDGTRFVAAGGDGDRAAFWVGDWVED